MTEFEHFIETIQKYVEPDSISRGKLSALTELPANTLDYYLAALEARGELRMRRERISDRGRPTTFYTYVPDPALPPMRDPGEPEVPAPVFAPRGDDLKKLGDIPAPMMRMRFCGYCRKEMEPAVGTGRPKVYCSPECAAAAREEPANLVANVLGAAETVTAMNLGARALVLADLTAQGYNVYVAAFASIAAPLVVVQGDRAVILNVVLAEVDSTYEDPDGVLQQQPLAIVLRCGRIHYFRLHEVLHPEMPAPIVREDDPGPTPQAVAVPAPPPEAQPTPRAAVTGLFKFPPPKI